MPSVARSAPALVLALVFTCAVASATAAPTIKEFEIPTKDLAPSGITAGPDGNLWFALTGKEGVGFSTPSGTISEFKAGFSGTSQGIAAGADGNVWFTEPKANKIGRITTLGVLTEYPAEGEPTGITAGPDGNLWFTEPAKAGAIGRINPSTGKVSEFSVGLTPNSKPQGITAGPDGALWFTEVGEPRCDRRITATGTITEYRTGLTTNSQPTGIAAGPDGALWFTEFGEPGGDRQDHDHGHDHRVQDRPHDEQPSPQGSPRQTTATSTSPRQADPGRIGINHSRGPDLRAGHADEQQPARRHHDGLRRQPLVHRGGQSRADRHHDRGPRRDLGDGHEPDRAGRDAERRSGSQLPGDDLPLRIRPDHGLWLPDLARLGGRGRGGLSGRQRR